MDYYKAREAGGPAIHQQLLESYKARESGVPAVPAGRPTRAVHCLHCGGDHRRVSEYKSGCLEVALCAAKSRAA